MRNLRKSFFIFQCMSLYMLFSGIITWMYPSQCTYRMLFNSIQYNGCFAIKIAQWICARNDIDYNKLTGFENLFKNNNVHSIEHTRRLFIDQIGESIDTCYKSIELTSSGSVAQVYKCIDFDDNYFALKVKHPNINKSVKKLWNLLKFLLYISKVFKIFSFLNILQYTDVDKLLNSFMNQTDFKLEADTMRHFYNNYKENRYIIVPEVIKATDDIIIMTYEDSTSISDIPDSIKKYEIMMLLLLLYKDMAFFGKFLHCDLHMGNWGVRENSIVVYDFGYAIAQNAKFRDRTLRWVSAYEKLDKQTCMDIMKNEFVLNNTGNDFQTTALDQEFSMQNNINECVKYCKLNNSIIEFSALELMIAFNCIENLCKTNLNHYYNVDSECQLDNYHNSRKECVVYSKKYGFTELYKMYNIDEDFDSFQSICTDDVSRFYNST